MGNKKDTLRLLMSWYQNHEPVPIEHHSGGLDGLFGFALKSGEEGFIIPVETGSRVLPCRCTKPIEAWKYVTVSTEELGAEDNCPECGTQLIPLYTYNSYVSMDFFGSEGQHTLYGYWCEGCQKMHPKEQES